MCWKVAIRAMASLSFWNSAATLRGSCVWRCSRRRSAWRAMSPIVLTLGGDASPFVASSVILQAKPVIRHQGGRHESQDTEKGPRERNSQLRQGDVCAREPRGADLAGAERILPV